MLGVIVECSALNRTYTSTLQRLKSTAEEEAEKKQELEDGEECCEMMLSSGHGMTIALMNSQELWLPAQNQTSQHSSIDWGGAHEAAPLDKELFATDECRGSKVIVL